MTKKCEDCGGSGFVLCVVWRTDGYNDYPGSYGSFERLGPIEDMARYWREPCKLCGQTGYIHYGKDGRLLPGRE